VPAVAELALETALVSPLALLYAFYPKSTDTQFAVATRKAEPFKVPV
jgi:hypothetical protein